MLSKFLETLSFNIKVLKGFCQGFSLKSDNYLIIFRLDIDIFSVKEYNNFRSHKSIEVWLSLVERCVRDAEAASSNLVTSTTPAVSSSRAAGFSFWVLHPPFKAGFLLKSFYMSIGYRKQQRACDNEKTPKSLPDDRLLGVLIIRKYKQNKQYCYLPPLRE